MGLTDFGKSLGIETFDGLLAGGDISQRPSGSHFDIRAPGEGKIIVDLKITVPRPTGIAQNRTPVCKPELTCLWTTGIPAVQRLAVAPLANSGLLYHQRRTNLNKFGTGGVHGVARYRWASRIGRYCCRRFQRHVLDLGPPPSLGSPTDGNRASRVRWSDKTQVS